MDELHTTTAKEKYAHTIGRQLVRAVGAEIGGMNLHDLDTSALNKIYET
jgi:hypothetical protein